MEQIAASDLFIDDADYLARYFPLCALYYERSSALSSAQSKHDDKTDNESNSSHIELLNKKLVVAKSRFNDDLSSSRTSGKTFFLEELAACCHLCEIEKMIVVLLLYFKYERPDASPFTRYEILGMLDVDDNILNRLKWNRYFWEDAPLIRAKIVQFHSECYHRGSDETKYWLNPKIVELFSRAASGERVNWQQQINLLTVPAVLCNDVGFRKSPVYTFDDVVVKDSIKEEILTVLDCHKGQLFDELGVFEVMKKGTGSLLLFYGPPGTGKSILAEAVAAHLGKDMLIAEYSKILNRWVGDTDKSIANLFKTAKLADLVVVLDEADSLLCNRNFAGQDHDIRFVNGMLQELERFEGIVVLTTNLAQMLDPALERRISLKIELHLPEPELRVRLWRQHMPPGIMVSDDVSFERLAELYQFSGGNIKNAVMHALRRLIRQKTRVLEMRHLIAGAELEASGMISSKSNRAILGFIPQ